MVNKASGLSPPYLAGDFDYVAPTSDGASGTIPIITPIIGHTTDQHAQALANYLPHGKLWAGKNLQDTNLRKFLEGLAQELIRTEGYLKAFSDEYIPVDLGDIFLDEWERVLGIPDDCFTGTGDVAERKRDILVKLASLGVQTVEDFENLAAIFGVVVDVIPGNDYYTSPGFPFPITQENSRYYIVIEFNNPNPGFPYTFPFTFGGEEGPILECLYRKLKPANCEVYFTEV